MQGLLGTWLLGCNPATSPIQREESSQNSKPAVLTAAADASGLENRSISLKEGWPNLFGPDHNSVSSETGLHFQWSATGPPEHWRRAIGAGYSAPAALGDRLVLFHRLGDEEIVECLDAETGRSRWQYAYPTAYKCQYEYSDGPVSTPILEENRVYTLGAEGELVCLDGEGQKIWRRSLVREYDVPPALFGVGGSPLLEGDCLVLNLGGQLPETGIIALDKQTGKTRWTATDHPACYSTPVAATMHGRRYLFVLTDHALVSLDPADGRAGWSIPFRARSPDSPNATSPVVAGDIVFISMGNGLGSLAVRVLPDGGYQELWRDRKVLDSQWNNLLPVDGHVYGYASTRAAGENFRCVDLQTGRLRWKWRSNLRRGSAIAADGHFILLGEYGHLASMQISPDAPLVVSKTAEPILEQPCYTMPALHRGLLYLRNETTLLCLNLRFSLKSDRAQQP